MQNKYKFPSGYTFIDESIALTPHKIKEFKELLGDRFAQMPKGMRMWKLTDNGWEEVKTESSSLPEITESETPLRDGTVKE